jgi:small subunit ribosomal protein S16
LIKAITTGKSAHFPARPISLKNNQSHDKEIDSMVRIRLRRVGAKGQPSYRIIAADKEAPRDGRFLEILGFYNPRTNPSTIQVKEDRVFEWISKGAQMSDSVQQVFRSSGTLERYERFKQGEDIEVLLQEARAAEEVRNANPKTKH